MATGTSIAQLFAEVGVDTRPFDRGLAGVDKALDKTAKGIGGFGSIATTAFLGVAGAVAGVAAGMGGLAVAATRSAASFEQGIANIRADLNLTAADTERVGELIKELGIDPNLQVNAVQASEAIHMLGKNGLTLDQIMNGAARSTVLLANSTGGSFAQSADIATDVMSLFNIKAEEMNRAVNGIVGTTQFSKFGIQDYALALAQGGGVAASVGVSFEDFNATIAAISPLFASGSDAGTSFKVLLQRLVPQTEKAKTTMKELGLMTESGANAFFDSAGNMKSMSEIAGLLQRAFSKLTEEQKTLAASELFGTDAMRAAFGLASAGSSGIDKFLSDIGGADAEAAAATRMDTFSGQIEVFQGILETLGIEIGQKFLPLSRKMVERFSDLASKYGPSVVAMFGNIAEWLGSTIDKAIDFGSAMVGRFLPPIRTVVGFLVNNLPDAYSKFRQIVDNVRDPRVAKFINRIRSSFAGLGKILTKLTDPFKDVFGGLFKSLMVARGSGWAGIFDTLITRLMTAIGRFGTVLTNDAIPFIKEKLGELGGAIKGWIDSVDWWDKIGEWAGKFGAWAGKIWTDHVSPALVTFWNSVTSWVTDEQKRTELWNNIVATWDWFTEWAGKVWEAVSPLLATLWTNLSTWFTDENKRTIIWDAVVNGWNVLTEWAGKIWEAVSPLLGTVWTEISSWFTDEQKRTQLWNAIVSVWNVLTSWATSIWEWAKPHLETGWNWLAGWFTEEEKRTQLWNGIKNVWDFVTKWAGKIWEWASPKLAAAWKEITSWVTDPQKRTQLWNGVTATWTAITDWAGKVWEWASPHLAAAWTEITSWVTNEQKRTQLFNAIKNTWNGFTEWASKVWDDGQGGGIKPHLQTAWDFMDSWIDTNLPDLAPWKDAFIEFAKGAADQWAISFPAMAGHFTELRATLDREIPLIESAFARLWKAFFGGESTAEDNGRSTVSFLEKMFGAISKTIGTIISQSRILMELLAINVEATKAFWSGDFDTFYRLWSENDAKWQEFGEVTQGQWDFFKGLFSGSGPTVGGNPGGFAHGGRATFGGMAWVGENGPELVDLPAGSYVHNNRNSMGMMGGTQQLHITLDVNGVGNLPGDSGKIRELARALQRELQLSGARVLLV